MEKIPNFDISVCPIEFQKNNFKNAIDKFHEKVYVPLIVNILNKEATIVDACNTLENTFSQNEDFVWMSPNITLVLIKKHENKEMSQFNIHPKSNEALDYFNDFLSHQDQWYRKKLFLEFTVTINLGQQYVHFKSRFFSQYKDNNYCCSSKTYIKYEDVIDIPTYTHQ